MPSVLDTVWQIESSHYIRSECEYNLGGHLLKKVTLNGDHRHALVGFNKATTALDLLLSGAFFLSDAGVRSRLGNCVVVHHGNHSAVPEPAVC